MNKTFAPSKYTYARWAYYSSDDFFADESIPLSLKRLVNVVIHRLQHEFHLTYVEGDELINGMLYDKSHYTFEYRNDKTDARFAIHVAYLKDDTEGIEIVNKHCAYSVDDINKLCKRIINLTRKAYEESLL